MHQYSYKLDVKSSQPINHSILVKALLNEAVRLTKEVEREKVLTQEHPRMAVLEAAH